jgi:hypothetical protein
MRIASTEDLMPVSPAVRLFHPPNELDCTIWRFMGLDSFRQILETSSILFSRADLLGDRFEGSIPLQNVRIREAELEGILPIHPGLEERRDEVRIERLGVMENFGRSLPARMFASCWHMRDTESDFWHLYADRTEAICIRSTFRRLHELTPCAMVGTVQYRDFSRDALPGDAVPPFGPFFYKRLAYAHETEARAVIFWIPRVPKASPPERLGVQVVLDQIIDAVYFSPYAPQGFEEAVHVAITQHGLTLPLYPSSLATEPFY